MNILYVIFTLLCTHNITPIRPIGPSSPTTNLVAGERPPMTEYGRSHPSGDSTSPTTPASTHRLRFPSPSRSSLLLRAQRSYVFFFLHIIILHLFDSRILDDDRNRDLFAAQFFVDFFWAKNP